MPSDSIPMHSGNSCRHGPASPGTAPGIVVLYAALLRARAFDAKAVVLQRTGRQGTYASSLGQQALSVGLDPACPDLTQGRHDTVRLDRAQGQACGPLRRWPLSGPERGEGLP